MSPASRTWAWLPLCGVLCGALPSQSREGESGLEALRRREIASELPRLQSDDEDVRRSATRALERLRAVEAIPALREVLTNDRSPGERAAAIRALAMLDAEEVVPLLRPLLDAENTEVQRAAAMALAMFDDAESRAKVVAVYENLARTAFNVELWEVGMTGLEALAPCLERIVIDPKEELGRRYGAIYGLSWLGSRGSAAVASLHDGIASMDVEEHDRTELESLALRFLAQTDPEKHRERFARNANSDQPEVRRSALLGLAVLGDTTAETELRRLGEPVDPSTRVPKKLKTRLAVRLRLSRVKGCTVGEVLDEIRNRTGVRISVSPELRPADLDHRFGGTVEMLGLRPSALSVLLSMTTSGPYFVLLLPPQVEFTDDEVRIIQFAAPKPPQGGPTNTPK